MGHDGLEVGAPAAQAAALALLRHQPRTRTADLAQLDVHTLEEVGPGTNVLLVPLHLPHIPANGLSVPGAHSMSGSINSSMPSMSPSFQHA